MANVLIDLLAMFTPQTRAEHQALLRSGQGREAASGIGRDDPVLAAHPDRFELGSSPAGRMMALWIGGAALAAGLLVTVALAIAGMPHPWLYGVVAVIAGACAMIPFLSRRAWRLVDGRALHHRALGVRGDLDALCRQLATGDPEVYLPLPVRALDASAGATLQAFWPESEAVTWIVLVQGRGGSSRPGELVELRDAQHADFQAALRRGLDRAA